MVVSEVKPDEQLPKKNPFVCSQNPGSFVYYVTSLNERFQSSSKALYSSLAWSTRIGFIPGDRQESYRNV